MKTYNSLVDISDADCVIGLSFGSSTHENSVNNQLALTMMRLSEGRPLIADRTLVDASPGGEAAMSHIVDGATTNIKAEGVGTWGTLVEARGIHAGERLVQSINDRPGTPYIKGREAGCKTRHPVSCS